MPIRLPIDLPVRRPVCLPGGGDASSISDDLAEIMEMVVDGKVKADVGDLQRASSIAYLIT